MNAIVVIYSIYAFHFHDWQTYRYLGSHFTNSLSLFLKKYNGFNRSDQFFSLFKLYNRIICTYFIINFQKVIQIFKMAKRTTVAGLTAVSMVFAYMLVNPKNKMLPNRRVGMTTLGAIETVNFDEFNQSKGQWLRWMIVNIY